MLVKEIEMKKWGNSQGVRFGKEELAALGESNPENLKLEMVVTEGKIVLTPKKKKPETLDELFSTYEGEPLGEEDKYEWGNTQGREII
ncbi:toxin-antitoxin system, antitoxin component, AbrB family protein [Enterococcus faecium]|uniref:AbrB/MazE/SpoVT family DNA-binding domain-containing protein n=1 Tax=Enterococcus faecium TaxID=1352 RepID=UPI001921B53D|nr:toxin-antitoxin system, antitoxin component, AbrB family protein [Enterococcus faecium]EGP4894982.1 toxin-antitoxin system, antitoxin component, AbrB family protein [Enterococcus faecium]EMF0115715.1 toxin-antitoxin system, antitoxin component, AbrB family protein [Enterococcus hirae]MBL3708776.1 toxin-antitoxin system, antitoxin component, AbrB family protein [Enterococcus faecium]